MIKYELSQSNHCTQRTWNDNQVKNPEGRCESKFGTKPILSLNKKKNLTAIILMASQKIVIIVRLQKNLANWNQSIVAQTKLIQSKLS